MGKEFYVCGRDCEECPAFEECHYLDEIDFDEDCEDYECEEGRYEDQYAPDLLDQEFEDRISGYDYEME